MSRVAAAPVSKFSRVISSTAANVSRAGRSSLLDSTNTAQQHGGAALMPKYAELLRERELSKSRGITTAHRPTPQPSIVDRPRPLMQTFHSDAAPRPPASTQTQLDAMIIPSMTQARTMDHTVPGVPLLPDNYGVAHAAPRAVPPTLSKPAIFAAEPDRVAPATPFSAVEGLSMDGVELKFAHTSAETDEQSHHMIRDLWKGIGNDAVVANKTA